MTVIVRTPQHPSKDSQENRLQALHHYSNVLQKDFATDVSLEILNSLNRYDLEHFWTATAFVTLILAILTIFIFVI